MSDKKLAVKLDEVQRKIEQGKNRLDDLEKRLDSAVEKWLARLKKQA